MRWGGGKMRVKFTCYQRSVYQGLRLSGAIWVMVCGPGVQNFAKLGMVISEDARLLFIHEKNPPTPDVP